MSVQVNSICAIESNDCDSDPFVETPIFREAWMPVRQVLTIDDSKLTSIDISRYKELSSWKLAIQQFIGICFLAAS